jgi:hypothetical protein
MSLTENKSIRVALITRSFYPNSLIAAKRATNLYRYLNDCPGLIVDVFTESLNQIGAREDCPLPGPGRVIYLQPYRNKFEAALFGDRTAGHRLLARTIFRNRLENGLARAVEASGLIDSYDAFYLTLPPFAPLLRLALRLQRRYQGKRIILEYRDEWLDGLTAYAENNRLIHPYHLPKSLYRQWRHRLRRRRDRRLEEAALHAADLIIVVSRDFRGRLLQRIPGLDPSRIVWSPNGVGNDEIEIFSRLRREQIPDTGDYLNLVYAGLLFGPQDIRPLLRAVKRLLAAGEIRPGEIRINLYGNHRQHAADWPRELRELVRFRGMVSRQEIFRQYFLHDLIVFLIGDWPRAETIITGKIFELIESGRPLLALLPRNRDGDARLMLKKTRAARIVDIGDEAAIAAALLDLLRQKRARRPLGDPRQNLDWFHRRYHYRRICRSLGKKLLEL